SDGESKLTGCFKLPPAGPVAANEIRVAPGAARPARPAVRLAPGPEIAPGEAQKDCGTPGLSAFALQGVIELLDRGAHGGIVRPTPTRLHILTLALTARNRFSTNCHHDQMVHHLRPGNRLHSFYTKGSQKVRRWPGPHSYHESEGLPPRNNREPPCSVQPVR